MSDSAIQQLQLCGMLFVKTNKENIMRKDDVALTIYFFAIDFRGKTFFSFLFETPQLTLLLTP